MYKKIYQCRLCNKIITEDLFGESYEGISLKMLNDSEFTKESIHLCNDNELGKLEFIGIKFVNQLSI